MLAALFTLAVVGSLFTSGLLFFEVIPGSPLVMLVVGGTHAIFAGGMFYGYSQYRAMHMLVVEGRGELFEMAISARIGGTEGALRGALEAQRRGEPVGSMASWLSRLFLVNRPGRQGDGDSRIMAGLKEHYRLRRVQGLQLSGLPDLAVLASEGLTFGARDFTRGARKDLAASLAMANIDLGQVWWARRELAAWSSESDALGHRDLRVASARLALAEGRYDSAEELLRSLADVRHFPFTPVLRSRNRYWHAESLSGLGRTAEAYTAFERAERAAPKSFWASEARRRRLAL